VSETNQLERLVGMSVTQENKNMTKEKTLADHAEEWAEEQGMNVPDRGSSKWQVMYERWVAFAFDPPNRQL
jgi:hypothetical protein